MTAVNKTIANVNPASANQYMLNLLAILQSSAVDQLLVSGALAIHGSSSALAKTGSTAYALANGVLVKLTGADMPALAGTVVNATFNVFAFYVNSAGTTSTLMGTAGATIGAIGFPATPANAVMLGFVIINPTGTGNFVGGTTNLDDATVVPNAVYINTLGDFCPAALTL